LTPPRFLVGYALRVTDNQCADPVRHGPGDDLLGGLVMGVADLANVARLGSALRRSNSSPPAAAPPGSLGGLAGQMTGAPLGVFKMEAFLGSELPPRYQEPRSIRAGDSVGVDDSEVYPGHPGTVESVILDGNFSGDVEEEPSSIGQEGHGSHRGWVVRNLTREADPQRR
jgi:hypothetical protein